MDKPKIALKSQGLEENSSGVQKRK